MRAAWWRVGIPQGGKGTGLARDADPKSETLTNPIMQVTRDASRKHGGKVSGAAYGVKGFGVHSSWTDPESKEYNRGNNGKRRRYNKRLIRRGGDAWSCAAAGSGIKVPAPTLRDGKRRT